jgi:tetratricopeptide (TPR) repeat protein
VTRGVRAAPSLLLLLLVAGSTARSLSSGFAFDDVPILVENAAVHRLAWPWTYAQQSYWPPRDLGDAYRPWTVWWLALQWAAGGGAPWVFHLGSLLLTAVVTLLVFRLACQLLPRGGALAAGAIFAVHPVHVEATANVVGQAELWMAGFCLAAALVYARARQAGIVGPGARLALAALYLLAAASKEQGIVLPGLLAGLELLGPNGRSGEPWRRRIRDLAPTYSVLAVAGLGFLLARYLVLGDLGGGPPAAGLAGRGIGERALVMLPLVGEWARLLLWPQALLAQYSPPQFGGEPAWAAGAWLGLGLLGAVLVLVLRRAGVFSVAACWTAVALLPVSNVFFPTGILVAERTLFLPSVGIAVGAGGLAAWLVAQARGPAGRSLAAAGVVGLATAGLARSWSRQVVWRDNDTLFQQTIVDGPRSYRAFFVYGKHLQRTGNFDRAKGMYARAAELYSLDRRVFEEWGFVLRAEGRCAEAVAVLERGVAADPRETLARSRLFECLLTLERYAQARAVAEEGVRLGAVEFKTSVTRAEQRAPPGYRW